MTLFDCIFNCYNSRKIPKWLTIFCTVTTDICNKSNSIIKFIGRNEYLGFTVIKSTDEKNRRAISWFYRNYRSPNIREWRKFITLFKLDKIPEHEIILWNKDKTLSDKVIKIHEINENFIKYTIDGETVTVPIGFGTLLPEKYLFYFTNILLIRRRHNAQLEDINLK